MQYVKGGLCAALIALAPVSVQAQQALAVGGPQQPILRAGSPVTLRTSIALTTEGKKLRPGERVPLEVAEAVSMNGQVVIPAGSTGMGEITTVRNKGMWGKSGGLTGRVLYIRVGDRQIRMSGTFDDKGKTGTAGVVAAIALIPVAGFFTTGTSARIPAGTAVSAFLDEDVPVALAAGTPVQAPLQAAPATSTGSAVASVGTPQ
jgi:hypothetical protein